MAPETDHSASVRALRQLRRIRLFYAGGAVLWAVSAALGGWDDPGGRQMWVSVVLLLVFTGLLSATSVWLGRRQSSRAGGPVHHAAPRRTPWHGQANA
ncbi:hypothetical protein ACOT81_36880 [Streptomyces sp. WI04-05B]|uniref:hypothetical protein n=1 Tax=Streptomyces TaxID=1883 RepID=UPI0029BDDB93|nr:MULTISPECIES: hypothetical protein [unclassified Streptomyces]MDX2546438.1 hypothetical protein [Streptomyces sp. WI04-05B]MDX2586201.1 hypothetical protein [Streptomyces sp. WI04-05A]MDX3748852.1 hypothetical protein [Streptomyces sp. AK08-02]